MADQEHHHIPQPGHAGLRIGEGTPTGQAGFLTVRGPQGTLYAPLAGLNPADVLLGGYGWLSPTDYDANGVPHTFHCGVDLNSAPPGASGGCNADLGLPVVAMLDGVIEACLPWNGSSPGEGNHLWYRLDSALAPAPTWLHHDHLSGFAVGVGQHVAAGALLGWCGKSGGWSCAHLHTELLPAAPAQGYSQWPYQWPQGLVAATYYAPRDWWAAASAKVQGAQPEEVAMLLSGAQTSAIQAVVWGPHWDPAAADFAIPASWRDEWHAGRWRGAPLASEQPVPADPPEGKPAGSWQPFQLGAAVYVPGQPVSWNG
jgi:hypothetical protein